jgi:hypothetical protein
MLAFPIRDPRFSSIFLRRLVLPHAGRTRGSLRRLLRFVGSRLQAPGRDTLAALFWIFHPHAIESLKIQDAAKLFFDFCFCRVFAFQVRVAERLWSSSSRQDHHPGLRKSGVLHRNRVLTRSVQDPEAQRVNRRCLPLSGVTKLLRNSDVGTDCRAARS